MRRLLMETAGLAILLAVPSHAQSVPNGREDKRDAAAPVSSVQPAPGGGDMVVLGPELRYVTRGTVDPEGHVRVGCGRETAAPDATRTPK